MTLKRTLIGATTLLFVLALTIPALADGPSAIAWLKTQQNADGGFGSPKSTIGATADVIVAAAAAGENALIWSKAGSTPMGYIKANLSAASKAADLGKVIMALAANGLNPRKELGTDLVKKLESMIAADGKIGGSNEYINEQCVAMIALRSVFRPPNPQTISYLLSRQVSDGTWSWNGDTTPGSGDNNTTAMAVIALVDSGVSANHEQIKKAMAHLKSQQNTDGGFPYINPSAFGTASDSNSTAMVIWAILATGQDVTGVDWKYFATDGTTPMDRLRKFQNASGAFHWQESKPDDNFMSTVQALIALQFKSLPVAKYDVDQPAKPTPTPTTAPGTTTTTVSDANVPPPETLPETGLELWIAAALMGGGLTLAGIGARLRGARLRGTKSRDAKPCETS